jgi:uncharacterized RDD family membrane protein YckC
MKCPKCQYIGFETGDRCRNCGYDFSLLADDVVAAPPDAWEPPDLALRLDTPDDGAREPMDLSLRPPEGFSGESSAEAPALPLFRDDDEAEDEPLVRIAAPRPPIAVRKTPEAQRLRFARPIAEAPRTDDAVFEFGTEPEDDSDSESVTEIRQSWGLDAPTLVAAPVARERYGEDRQDGQDEVGDASPLRRRIAAALIDFGLLFAIDAVVIHFTLRLTALTLADWRVIPLTPLLIFLVGLKLAYLSAFTLAGGQTIGKMAMGIRVIAADDGQLDMSQAVRRSVVEVASLVAAGVPFLLALADPGRRGLHDRVAHTRVVALS